MGAHWASPQRSAETALFWFWPFLSVLVALVVLVAVVLATRHIYSKRKRADRAENKKAAKQKHKN